MSTLNLGEQSLGTNQILCVPDTEILVSSKVLFHGKGNILFIEPGGQLQGSRVEFFENSSLAYMGASRYVLQVKVLIFNDSVMYLGRNCSFNGVTEFNVSECRRRLNLVRFRRSKSEQFLV